MRIIDININEQSKALYRASSPPTSLEGEGWGGGGNPNEWRELGEKGKEQVLTEAQILELSDLIVKIENHYGFPCDIEWAFEDGKFYIVQSRPITTLATEPSFNNTPTDKIFKNEWVKNVTREVTIFPATGVTKSFGQVSQAFNIPFDYQHILFVDNTWFYKQKEYKAIQNIFRKEIEEDAEYVLKISSKQKKVGENLKRYVKELATKDFSRDNLLKNILEYDRRMTEFYSFWWIAIPAGEVLEEKVRTLLINKRSTLKFEDLMFVRNELELVREKRLRNEIGLKCGRYANYDKLPDALRQEFEKHADEFGWINTSYHIGSPLRAEDFFEKVLSEDPLIETKQAQDEREREKSLLEVFAKDFSSDEQKLIEAMQSIIYARNYQKETVNECQHKSEPFLRQVARYLDVELNVFLSFSPQEIYRYLFSKDVMSSELAAVAEKRAKGFVIEYKYKKITVYEGEDIRAYQTRVKSGQSTEGIKEVKGSLACRGQVTGKVRVILKKEDIASFIDGEVLVAVMTSIDYVHVMKRASAVVTDEGGITCHAAIFSREFGVPCIIGTKIATQVLHDGDLVEVDADNGVVRVIERAEKQSVFVIY